MSESPLSAVSDLPDSPKAIKPAKLPAIANPPSGRSSRGKKTTYKEESASEEEEEVEGAPAAKKAKFSNGKAAPLPKPKAKGKGKKAAKDDEDVKMEDAAAEGDEAESTEKKPKKARTPRQPKIDPFSAEALATHPARYGPPASVGENAKPTSKYHTESGPTHRIGAHTSAAGGVENALLNASQLGGRSLALFLKNQKKWESAPFTEENVSRFRKMMMQKDMGGLDYPSDYILPHGSYLINLGNPEASKREVSYKCFIDDLKRCEQLGIKLYNWHPGSAVGGSSKEDALKHVAESVNRAHKETEFVIPVIENMAGAGNVLGSTWEELATIIEHVENKDRIGVCLDTCHMFAAGYDIRTPETYAESIASFDKIVGLKYLKGMHINDSKGGGFNCKKDRHENIGLGEIGLEAFRQIVQDPRLANIPLILETPTFEETHVWQREIQLLYELQEVEGDGSSEEVKGKLEEMRKAWEEERGKMRAESGKEKKGPKAPVKGKGKGKGKALKEDVDEDGGEEEEEVEEKKPNRKGKANAAAKAPAKKGNGKAAPAASAGKKRGRGKKAEVESEESALSEEDDD